MEAYATSVEQDPSVDWCDKRLVRLLLNYREALPVERRERLLKSLKGLERRTDPETVVPFRLGTLALLRVFLREGEDLSIAFRHATKAVERTERQEPRLLAVLACVHFERGDTTAARKTLEEARQLPRSSKVVEALVERYENK
jgi:hypothetical protein